MNLSLNTEQRAAVDMVLRDRPTLACLTGGPGTGKTTTIRALITEAQKQGIRVQCAAPSGKAAQRMAQQTGRPAQTLHRMLGLQPGSFDYSPVVTGILVVDEASMVDAQLMAATLMATRSMTPTVLLVGDGDQLPPVGPGQPFLDLLRGGVCPTARLTEIHRQAAESGIIRAAHSIVQGVEPEFAPDFQFVACDELQQIPAACWGVIEGERLNPSTSQILAPQRTTSGGVEEINRHIEAARFGGAEGEPLLRGRFRRGTKVISTKNDYDQGVFNGELGEVLEARPGSRPGTDLVRVQLGEREVRFHGSKIKQLAPAFALTVHKSQGSEWDDVIVVAHTSHSYMLTRRLLYVATTRAAKRVWIVGQAQALARAVRNNKDAHRETWLGRRFARDLQKRAEQAAAAGAESGVAA